MSHTCFEALSFPANHQDRHSCPPGPGRPSVSPSWSRASQKVSQSYLCTPGSAPQSSDAARISWQPHSSPAKPKAIFSGKFSKVNLNLNHSGQYSSLSLTYICVCGCTYIICLCVNVVSCIFVNENMHMYVTAYFSMHACTGMYMC